MAGPCQGKKGKVSGMTETDLNGRLFRSHLAQAILAQAFWLKIPVLDLYKRGQ